MTKACRTTSTSALQVIAGTKPLDIKKILDALIKRIKRNITTTWKSYEYREKETVEFQESLSLEIARVRSFSSSAWQGEWDEEIHGRNTYNFIHDVSFAIQNRTCFVPNRFATYLTTGYGPINSTLFKIGITDENNCPKCGDVNESRDHIIFDCMDYDDIRWPEMSQ